MSDSDQLLSAVSDLLVDLMIQEMEKEAKQATYDTDKEASSPEEVKDKEVKGSEENKDSDAEKPGCPEVLLSSSPAKLTARPVVSKQTAKLNLNSACMSLIFQGGTEAELKAWLGYKVQNVRESSGHVDARVLSKSCAHPEDLGPPSSEFNSLEELTNEFKAIPDNEVTQEKVLALADKYKFLFVNNEFWLSQQWQRLCRDALNGSLPDGVLDVALSALMEEKNPLAYRVYTEEKKIKAGRMLSFKVTDYSNTRTKFQLFRYLESTKVKAKLMLKPDVFTVLGIYSDSPQYNFRPTIEHRYINMKPSVPRSAPPPKT